MRSYFNIWGFTLITVTLVLAGLSLYMRLYSEWKVIPSESVLIVMAVVAFILGLLGDAQNKWAVMRSVVTLIISPVLALLLVAVSGLSGNVLTHIDTTDSPDGKYTVDLYLGNGGAATSYWIVGKIDGPLWTEKQIYYEYRQDQADFEWVNDEVIEINGHQVDLGSGETFTISNERHVYRNP
ncbi:hypothetical protein E3U55_06495 [Filobacillus milosensis]|uniref:DUF5412 domain-containing protein n=1 Tax=Filobacillus milosensis TaxID=94137 RepID=A0A4Y8IQZ0_9BACI|nr:DUF5412 family protein [Filobacillus milosensis]TFB22884.1 hypothetical protein E3U55_06495 [Filobacillus milosensis]